MKPRDIHRDACLKIGEGKIWEGDQRITPDVRGSIAVHWYMDDDSLTIQGNVKDLAFAVGMLDHAEQTIAGRLSAADGIVVPARDVRLVQRPDLFTVAVGEKPVDMRLSTREGKLWQGDQLVDPGVTYTVAVHYHDSGKLSIQSTAPSNAVAKLLVNKALANLRPKLAKPVVIQNLAVPAVLH